MTMREKLIEALRQERKDYEYDGAPWSEFDEHLGRCVDVILTELREPDEAAIVAGENGIARAMTAQNRPVCLPYDIEVVAAVRAVADHIRSGK